MRISPLRPRPRGTSWSVLAVIVLGTMAMASPMFANGTTSTSTSRAALAAGHPHDRSAVPALDGVRPN